MSDISTQSASPAPDTKDQAGTIQPPATTETPAEEIIDPDSIARLGEPVYYVLPAGSEYAGEFRLALVTSPKDSIKPNLAVMLDNFGDCTIACEKELDRTSAMQARAVAVPYDATNKLPGTWHRLGD